MLFAKARAVPGVRYIVWSAETQKEKKAGQERLRREAASQRVEEYNLSVRSKSTRPLKHVVSESDC